MAKFKHLDRLLSVSEYAQSLDYMPGGGLLPDGHLVNVTSLTSRGGVFAITVSNRALAGVNLEEQLDTIFPLGAAAPPPIVYDRLAPACHALVHLPRVHAQQSAMAEYRSRGKIGQLLDRLQKRLSTLWRAISKVFHNLQELARFRRAIPIDNPSFRNLRAIGSPSDHLDYRLLELHQEVNALMGLLEEGYATQASRVVAH
ncbi:hypothetical protein BKA70DRAFT_1445855 [Coprinopsis sp. MPI-PUGE-AT-0042]|nr:hypothetical protein BKA70DRAFT_1445855 [Coprinopsis sp. MPI-PUGE-AT-0042]